MSSSLIDVIFSEATQRAHTRMWLISDLQQSTYELAERYLNWAMEDMALLSSRLDGVCYLGDASAGAELPVINRMIDMELEKIDSLNVPVYYAIGNHELDYFHACRYKGIQTDIQVPFFEAVRHRPNWHLVKQTDEFWFSEELPEFTMLFFSDHLSPDGSWVGFHEKLPDASSPYPYTTEDWLAVRDRFAAQSKPVFSFSHYSFPGGNRPSDYLARILPLPPSFRAHFYGHAHIGDAKFAKENLYRQISAVNHEPIMQFDISSLDHWRGTTVRSAFFDYYGDGEYGVFFRDHIHHRWEQFFLSTHDARSAGVPEQFTQK